MATKSKANSTKKKTTSAADKEIQKAQSERFIETARELGVDETGKDFDLAIKRIIKKHTARNGKRP